MSKKTHKYITSFLLTLVLFACSVEKNTFVNRQFHNMTAHYNVYFNGEEAMKRGLVSIDERMEEDFSKILPIYKESRPGAETMVTSDMNTAIEKATKLIKFHSITKPPESSRNKNARKRKAVKAEYNKWVDDAFIMMGRAYLYQKNFIMAASTFTQVIRKYKDEEVKYLAYLWLLRTYNESERYAEARELLETLEGNDQFPENLEGELAINAADFHLKQQHYEEAIQYLNIGIKKIRGNKRKSRYTFILGQLYQEIGNKEKSLEAYQQVIRRRPDYEMMFNARIKSAEVFSGEGNVATLRKELMKMSKKLRNEPYLDQIYYALGNIVFNQGQTENAINYYKKSAAISLENTYQRAQSCLTLADIYFEQKEYIPAGMYYDSAMVVLDDNYPNYEQIYAQYQSLNSLVENLLTVETQDSLQLLAGLSNNELNTKINEWIAREEERLAKMETDEASGQGGQGAYGRSMSNRMSMGNQSGGWYFYNPSTVSYGKQEFKRLWGERKNADNWRRSNKSEVMYDETGEPLTDDMQELIKEEEQRIEDPTTKEYYMQDIPLTDSMMVVSNQKIKEALFNAGLIFQTEFNDYERAIENLKELNKRYPENTYRLTSWFHLWDLHKIVEEKDSAAHYKNLIIDKYPNSNYAKYLINPNYFIEEEARKDKLNEMYQQAFTNYQNRNFKEALKTSREVMNLKPDSLLIPKVRFISMVSASRQLPKKQFADSLSRYIVTYPDAEPTLLANQILELIREEKLDDYDELVNTGYLNEVIKNLELLEENETTEALEAAKWEKDEGLLHYFIIAIPNDDKIDINRLRFDIANYNIDFYTRLDFDIELENLNNKTKLIVVRNFSEKEAAMIYFHSIIRKPEVFKTLAGVDFINFVVSNINFREMLSDRQYENYLSFFVKNYSIHTTPFPEEELETPDELIARLNQDEDELVEKGEFVALDIDESQYDTPDQEDMVYRPDYDDAHSFLILINEARYRTGFMMRDLIRFNSANYRQKRLRVMPVSLPDATLLTAGNFENAYEAKQYLDAVRSEDELFSPLEDTNFELFIIGQKNLEQLRSSNEMEKWDEFYKRYYVYRQPPAPQQEEKNIEEANDLAPDEIPEAENEASISENEVESVEATPETEAAPVTKTEEPDGVQEDAPQTQEENAPAQEKPTTEANEEAIFSIQEDALHNVIYILPGSGSNQNLLITYINRLNAINYRGSNIRVEVENLDDFRSMVHVSGILNAKEGKEYLQKLDADNRIGMSLRNVNYKRFLISNDNLETFKKNKDIQAYQRFYDLNY